MATALEQYERLESSGLWKSSPDAQRREVILSFGRSALKLSDLNDNVLTHWHLNAVDRINPNRQPALYSPGDDESESVEVSDPHMIEAIETLRSFRPKPLPGRRWRFRRLLSRGVGFLVAVGIVIALVRLPVALEDHALEMTPTARIQAIDAMLLDELTRMSGPVCLSGAARPVLASLSARLVPDAGVPIIVAELGDRMSAHLPGGQILLDRSLIHGDLGPETAAGFVLLEYASSQDRHIFRSLIRHAGFFRTSAFLLGWELPRSVVESFAPQLLWHTPASQNPEFLQSLFAAAGLSSQPLSDAIGPESPLATALASSEESIAEGSDPGPVLDPSDWATLRAACSNRPSGQV
ncbi:MAG: hypothetical protein OXI81_11935 [Paracoccaceae bacterium]|nr:hypothetical protein [Paracoccaceae bacterium]MDE2914674.1 hypothetical protein [Paracoccaceae bacterium]